MSTTDTTPEEVEVLESAEVTPETEITEPELETEASEAEVEVVDEVVSAEAASKQARLTGVARSTGKQSGARNWYVIHTYAGYEDQVAQNIEQRRESLGMHDKIFGVLVPIEKQIEIKNGKRKTVDRKIFPGYVFVEMIVTDDSWYVVRNTPNVTGFTGFGVRPTPVSQQEMDVIRKRMGVDEPKHEIELVIGDLVQITDGALKGFQAKVDEVDPTRGKIRVLVSMFGRETPVTLDYLQLKRV